MVTPQYKKLSSWVCGLALYKNQWIVNSAWLYVTESSNSSIHTDWSLWKLVTVVHTFGDWYQVFDHDVQPPPTVWDKHGFPDVTKMGEFEYIYRLFHERTQHAAGRPRSFIATKFGDEYLTLGNFRVKSC